MRGGDERAVVENPERIIIEDTAGPLISYYPPLVQVPRALEIVRIRSEPAKVLIEP